MDVPARQSCDEQLKFWGGFPHIFLAVLSLSYGDKETHIDYRQEKSHHKHRGKGVVVGAEHKNYCPGKLE